MRWYSKFKRYRTKNFFKTKESFNLVNTNLLSFILPLFIHLSLFSYETRYVWMTSYIILAFYILYKDWKCLGTGLLAIILYLCLVLPTIVKPLLDDGLYIIKGTVVKLGTNYFIISNSKHNVLVYSNNSVSASSIVQGSLVEVKGNLNKNLSDIKFDKSFVLSNSIKYVVNNPIVNKVTYQTNSLSKIINAYGSNKIYFARYWSTMVFGINDSQIANVKARLINVLHLIVISGLHFDLLFYFIVFLAKKIFKKQTKTLYFVFMILFCYITLLNSFVSAIRSLIMLIIKHQKRIGNYKFKYYDGWADFTNSYICNKLRLEIFSLSFILSFSCSFILLALNRLLKIRWAFLKSLLIFTLIYIFNLPIIAKINNEINPLSLIFGIILAPIFEIYYLMSIMFFWSVDFMNFAYFLLDKLLDVLIDFSYPLTIKISSSWLI